ncbi:hypothetical protein VE00_05055 [Pseudogymnoascus sp. WSF 3629]|nr:hypothetical protein VE00_05055 [Pseudogymnoascus sp. WSF 3629]
MASDKWNEMLSSTETNFTWLNTINDGPSPIICPDDIHGEMDLTSELDSVFAKLQKNIKLLQNRISFVDSINRKLYDEWIKTEKAASDIERENQQLRIENYLAEIIQFFTIEPQSSSSVGVTSRCGIKEELVKKQLFQKLMREGGDFALDFYFTDTSTRRLILGSDSYVPDEHPSTYRM